MTNFRKFLSLTVLCITISGFVAGPSAAFELSTLVADSISAHPEVLEKMHLYRQALGDQVIAKSGWRPSIDLEATTGEYSTESPATGNTTIDYDSSRVELSVTQNLFNGFNTTHQLKQTEFRSRAALFDVYDTADNIALDAVQAYFDVLKQRRLYELAIANMSSHEKILAQIREKNSSGVGRRSQLQQTEGRVARAHASLIAQENNLQDSATLLHQILGRYVDPNDLREPVLPKLPEGDLDSLIDRALLNHPAMKVVANNIKASQADYKRSKSSDLPNIDLRLATETGDDIGGVLGSKDETSLVLNLTYNFYRGGADKANQQKKISATYEQKDFAARVRRQVINTLRLAWMADTSLARQLRFLKDYTVRAKETVGLYKEEFFIGQRDLIDLLDAENELNSALNQHEEAYFDALSSRYRVYEGGGTLFEALNLDVVLTENNLMVARINANSTDDLPLPKDLDADKESDVTDHCDNSLQNVGVNDYGCLQGNGGFKINSAPVAVDDEIELEGNSVLLITQSQILENDRDGDGDSLSVTGIGEVSNGQIAFDENKNIIYKPTEGFAGNDFFKYSLSDGNGGFSEATVALVVHATDNIDLCKQHYVNFVYGRTGLTDISTSKLQDIIDKVKQEKDVKIVFYAHTDSIGSDRYNKVLSQRRADAVKKLLVDNGIAAEIITVEGMGERMPIADNKYKAGRAINRRGEFVFLTDNDTASP